jgi:hypothetical protein
LASMVSAQAVGTAHARTQSRTVDDIGIKERTVDAHRNCPDDAAKAGRVNMINPESDGHRSVNVYARIEAWPVSMGEGSGRTRDIDLGRIRVIAKCAIQSCGFGGELHHGFVEQRGFLAEFEGGQLVPATRFQTRLDVSKALASHEPKEHAPRFRTNDQYGTLGEVNKMSPLQAFFKLRRSGAHSVAHGLREAPLPAREAVDVLLWRRCRRQDHL